MRCFGAGTILLLAAAGCGGTEPGRVLGELQLSLAATTLDDTIQADHETPVTATVIAADGLPVPDTAVTFSVLGARLGASAATFAGQTLRVVTDGQGQARVWVRNESVSGEWPLRVRITGTQKLDSVPLRVRPGRAISVALSPRDSTLYVGNTSLLRVERLDRLGNAASDLPAFTLRRPGIVSIEDSTVIRGLATGSTWIVAEFGQFRDSALVAVVPRGEIVTQSYLCCSNSTGGFYHTQLDGSAYRAVSVVFGRNYLAPRWSPSGDRVLFTGFVGIGAHLFTELPDGTRTQLTPALPGNQEFNGQYSRDGNWIYYAAQTPENQDATLWRAKPDGSEPQQILPGNDYSMPSPSPDGSRIAFVELLENVTEPALRLADLATGATTALKASGIYPIWAPSGEEIAFVGGGRLQVIDALSGDITVLDSTNTYDSRWSYVDWSPDAKWLVSCATVPPRPYPQLVVVERATREVIPLPWSVEPMLCHAAWRPTATAGSGH